MPKSDKELAVEIYCAKLIADAIDRSHSGEKQIVINPEDEMYVVARIEESLRKAFNP